jgi:predicted transcriptional regulator
MSDEQPAREPAMSTTATVTAKEEVMEFIRDLPDNLTFDEIMYEIFVLKKLKISMQASENGEVSTHEEVKERFKRWLTS